MLNTIIGLLITILTLSGCGSAPSVTLPTTSTVTQAVAGPTTAYTYPQAAQICAALKAWNPTATSIQFPGDPGNTAIYLFTVNQITQNNLALTSDVLYIGYQGTNYCVVTITAGKMVSCQ